jgi:hypothetical protein
MAASARPEASGTLEATSVTMEDVPCRTLCDIVQAYGQSVFSDTQRCEAFLRDLCGSYRREIFLLIAALKEHVVADLQSSAGSVPDEVLVARLTHKLCNSLGLAEGPAEWAVKSWLIALRAAPASNGASALAQASRTDLPAWPEPSDVPELRDPGSFASSVEVKTARIDWSWLGFSAIAIGSAALALAVVARVSLYHSGPSPKGWMIDTAILVAGLGLAALGEYAAARALGGRPAPCRVLLDPARAPAALLPEVLVMLIQPLVLVGVPALWVVEWLSQLHVTGQSHDFSFHLGRAVQSAVVAFFLVKWIPWMTTIQGSVASSTVPKR